MRSNLGDQLIALDKNAKRRGRWSIAGTIALIVVFFGGWFWLNG